MLVGEAILPGQLEASVAARRTGGQHHPGACAGHLRADCEPVGPAAALVAPVDGVKFISDLVLAPEVVAAVGRGTEAVRDRDVAASQKNGGHHESLEICHWLRLYRRA